MAPDGGAAPRDVRVVSIGGEAILNIEGLGADTLVSGIRQKVRKTLPRGHQASVLVKLVLGDRTLSDNMPVSELPVTSTIQAVFVAPGYQYLDQLTHEDPFVSSRAAAALGELGPVAATYASRVQELLSHEEVFVKTTALKAFEQFGKEAGHCSPAVAELLDDPVKEVRASAAEAYVQVASLEEWARTLLAHQDAAVRTFAVQSLGDALRRCPWTWDEAKGTTDTRLLVVKDLAALVRDPHDGVSAAALKCLEDDVPEIPLAAAAAHLSDERTGVRLWGTIRLKSAGKEAAPFAGMLAGVLRDKILTIKLNATRALGTLGPVAAPHVAALAELLQDHDDDLRYWAAWAISKTGAAAEVRESLLPVVADDYCSRVRCCVAKALASIENATQKEAEGVARALVALVDGPVDDRRCVAWAMGSLGESALSHADALIKLLKDQDPAVRRSTAETFGKLGPVAAPYGKELEKLLEDPSSDVRHWAKWALERVGK